MNADARTQFAAWIPDGDMGRFAKDLPHKLKPDFVGARGLLRNADFQKLLLEYPRAKRTFLTTIEEKDIVSSQRLERYGQCHLLPERPAHRARLDFRRALQPAGRLRGVLRQRGHDVLWILEVARGSGDDAVAP